jgi:hypothetical protein
MLVWCSDMSQLFSGDDALKSWSRMMKDPYCRTRPRDRALLKSIMR